MRVPFHKMHGAGNDFIIVDERHGALPLTPARIAALADRHRGIGCDQFITIGPADGADAALRFFNADGSESGACGNGTRCAAALLPGGSLTLRTAGGLLTAKRRPGGLFTVDMGQPRTAWHDIPLSVAADTLHLPLPGEPAAVSMGNPHVTYFDQDLDSIATAGPLIEHNKLFPDRVNVGFAQILAPDRIRLRVWERGAGLTLACGSGACATLVNAARRGLSGRHAAIQVDGGELLITWRDDDHVEMTGPVAIAFTGQFDLDDHPAGTPAP